MILNGTRRLQRRSLRLPRRKWAQGVFRQKSEQVSYKVECKGYTSTRNRKCLRPWHLHFWMTTTQTKKSQTDQAQKVKSLHHLEQKTNDDDDHAPYASQMDTLQRPTEGQEKRCD